MALVALQITKVQRDVCFIFSPWELTLNCLLQPFKPKLHMTDADFLSITLNGKLCDGEGGLGLQEFERVMREQVCPPIKIVMFYCKLRRSRVSVDFEERICS